MKKFIANAVLIIFFLIILGFILFQVGSPVMIAYRQHGLLGLFASLFAVIIIGVLFIAIIKLLSWAIDTIDNE